jgi:hypothetical protein
MGHADAGASYTEVREIFTTKMRWPNECLVRTHCLPVALTPCFQVAGAQGIKAGPWGAIGSI